MALKWQDADEIGFRLNERFPDVDPLTLRFTDLRQRVMELPEFTDDVDKSSEKSLEAIQTAWYSYFETAV